MVGSRSWDLGGTTPPGRLSAIAETAASNDLKSLRAELDATTGRLEGAIDKTNDRLEYERGRAQSGARRLLTEKGTPLAISVRAAFEQFGFRVEDLDSGVPAVDGAGRTEDFKLTDPDDPFDPLVEVKGYDRGARASDLSQLDRHETRAASGGRTPTAIWWVVNHWRFTSPDQREAVLASEGAILDERSKRDTPLVIIDTRHLFQAVKSRRRPIRHGRTGSQVSPFDTRPMEANVAVTPTTGSLPHFGLASDCVLNIDNVHTVPRAVVRRP